MATYILQVKMDEVDEVYNLAKLWNGKNEKCKISRFFDYVLKAIANNANNLRSK